MMDLNYRRHAFLAGEGILTAAEVQDWAVELEPRRSVSLPPGMSPDEPLMVSIVTQPVVRDRRGLTGAEIL